MAPLIPTDRGFTADVIATRTPRGRRRSLGSVTILAAVVASLVLGVMLIPGTDEEASTETNRSQQSVTQVDYLWKVYVLNQTARSEATNGTTFSFRTDDLPMEFGTILFGDFWTDAGGRGTYYGGCGILVEATGASETITLREIDGKFISSVQYNGQDPVVFSGERRSVSYPTVTTSYYGTDRIVQDWRNGTWSPDQGILVEHPADLTMVDSEFYLMLFEPEDEFAIPEFQDLPFVLAVLLGVLTIVCRRIRGRTRRLPGLAPPCLMSQP
jgi:hypothetical protein